MDDIVAKIFYVLEENINIVPFYIGGAIFKSFDRGSL